MLISVIHDHATANIYTNATADRLSGNACAASISAIQGDHIAIIPLPIDNLTTATNIIPLHIILMRHAYTISGKKIDAWHACKTDREDQYFCGCRDRMILKCGREKRPHFAHPPGSPHAISRHGDKVDSKAHMDMEENLLRNLYNYVETEKRIEINGNHTYRIVL
jgi:hypothetical protein